MYSEKDLYELYLALHVSLTNATSTVELSEIFEQVVPIVYESTVKEKLQKKKVFCSLNQIIQIVVLSITDIVNPSAVLEFFLNFLTLLEDHCSLAKNGRTIATVDIEKLIRSIQYDLSDILEVSEPTLKERATRLADFNNVLYKDNNFNFVLEESDFNHTFFQNIFAQFVIQRVQIVNKIIQDLSYFEKSLNIARSSRFCKHEGVLDKWICGFFFPLLALSDYEDTPLNIAYVSNDLSDHEIVKMMFTAYLKDRGSTFVIQSIIVPYISIYKNNKSWNKFNEMLQNFIASKSLSTTDITTVLDTFDIICEVMREDLLLKNLKINKQDAVFFFRIIVQALLETQSVSLKCLIQMKEILVLSRALITSNNTEHDKNFTDLHLDVRNIKNFVNSCEPAENIINYLLNLVAISERFYANKLSLIQISQLGDASSKDQLRELSKFIDNESKFSVDVKQWKIILNSTYWVYKNTSILNKVDKSDLDVMIREKLLELRAFKVYESLNFNDYNDLPNEKQKSLLLSHAWKYYNLSTNLDKRIGYFKSCVDCVNLLGDVFDNDSDVIQLKNLINANYRLLNYKLFFQSGVPITPKRILERRDPFSVIRRLLELNEDSNIDLPELYNILVELIIGFNCVGDDKEYQYYYLSHNEKLNPLMVKLKLLYLEFIVTEGNFQKSQEHCLALLDLAIECKEGSTVVSSLSNLSLENTIYELVKANWVIFFQIAKSDNSGSDEESIDVSRNERVGDSQLKQLVLSKLIVVVPDEFNSNVLELWKLINHTRSSGTDSNISLFEEEFRSDIQISSGYNMTSRSTNFQERLQRSMNSAASEVFSQTGANKFGSGILGWAIGS
ncbi:hypothetical protein BVG19_g5059 [[Candida] boidinii]|nr:hypothetical protein BVG19_g5059 [[Candida] boidinii]OWB52557.1 hypothetical protein B5S27_g4134 [[Candida] boidinii]